MSDDSYLPKFIKLSEFKSPAMPTQRAFEILLSKALLLLQTQEDKEENAISSDRLHKTTQDDLDLIAPGQHRAGY